MTGYLGEVKMDDGPVRGNVPSKSWIVKTIKGVKNVVCPYCGCKELYPLDECKMCGEEVLMPNEEKSIKKEWW
jgi:hypothetical protein